MQQHLPRSTSDRDDLESAGYCQVAAWMSIYNLTNVQVGLSHGLGHQLGARNDVPHGVTSCIMLPRVMEFNRSVTAPQQRRIAEAMGVDTRNANDNEAAAAAVSALENLIDTLGISRRLSTTAALYDQVELGQLSVDEVRLWRSAGMRWRKWPGGLRESSECMSALPGGSGGRSRAAGCWTTCGDC